VGEATNVHGRNISRLLRRLSSKRISRGLRPKPLEHVVDHGVDSAGIFPVRLASESCSRPHRSGRPVRACIEGDTCQEAREARLPFRPFPRPVRSAGPLSARRHRHRPRPSRLGRRGEPRRLDDWKAQVERLFHSTARLPRFPSTAPRLSRAANALIVLTILFALSTT